MFLTNQPILRIQNLQMSNQMNRMYQMSRQILNYQKIQMYQMSRQILKILHYPKIQNLQTSILKNQMILNLRMFPQMFQMIQMYQMSLNLHK